MASLSPTDRDRLQAAIHLDTIEELDPGRTYVVWALERWIDGVRVYLHAIESHHWPSPYPVELFEFVETSIPEGWSVSLGDDRDGAYIKRISFSAWAGDDGYYERLVDEDEKAVCAYETTRLAFA